MYKRNKCLLVKGNDIILYRYVFIGSDFKLVNLNIYVHICLIKKYIYIHTLCSNIYKYLLKRKLADVYDFLNSYENKKHELP